MTPKQEYAFLGSTRSQVSGAYATHRRIRPVACRVSSEGPYRSLDLLREPVPDSRQVTELGRKVLCPRPTFRVGPLQLSPDGPHDVRLGHKATQLLAVHDDESMQMHLVHFLGGA